MGVFVEQGYDFVSMEEYDRSTRDWVYMLCILPHKCIESNKWMWLTKAYRGRRFKRFDTQIVQLTDKWMSKEEFIKLRLLEKI